MSKRFPISPPHPERVCWGCDHYCAADSMACGNGSVRTLHPAELFGDDWMSFGLDAPARSEGAAPFGTSAPLDATPRPDSLT